MYGGNENLEAIDFLRRFNELAHQVPGAITAAEESTAFAGVSRPTYLNGLGFTMKWNMGWMHDMLDYFSIRSRASQVSPQQHHFQHAVRVHGEFHSAHFARRSGARQGRAAEQNAGRHVAEVRQRARVSGLHVRAIPERSCCSWVARSACGTSGTTSTGLPWEILHYDFHRKLQAFVAELNRLYRAYPAFYEVDFHWAGFEWVDFRDVDGSTISFIRRPQSGKPFLLFVCNFTPVPRLQLSRGRSRSGRLSRNTEQRFGNVGRRQHGQRRAMSASEPISYNGHYHSLSITLPPLAVVVFESPAA